MKTYFIGRRMVGPFCEVVEAESVGGGAFLPRANNPHVLRVRGFAPFDLLYAPAEHAKKMWHKPNTIPPPNVSFSLLQSGPMRAYKRRSCQQLNCAKCSWGHLTQEASLALKQTYFSKHLDCLRRNAVRSDGFHLMDPIGIAPQKGTMIHSHFVLGKDVDGTRYFGQHNSAADYQGNGVRMERKHGGEDQALPTHHIGDLTFVSECVGTPKQSAAVGASVAEWLESVKLFHRDDKNGGVVSLDVVVGSEGLIVNLRVTGSDESCHALRDPTDPRHTLSPKEVSFRDAVLRSCIDFHKSVVVSLDVDYDAVVAARAGSRSSFPRRVRRLLHGDIDYVENLTTIFLGGKSCQVRSICSTPPSSATIGSASAPVIFPVLAGWMQSTRYPAAQLLLISMIVALGGLTPQHVVTDLTAAPAGLISLSLRPVVRAVLVSHTDKQTKRQVEDFINDKAISNMVVVDSSSVERMLEALSASKTTVLLCPEAVEALSSHKWVKNNIPTHSVLLRKRMVEKILLIVHNSERLIHYANALTNQLAQLQIQYAQKDALMIDVDPSSHYAVHILVYEILN